MIEQILHTDQQWLLWINSHHNEFFDGIMYFISERWSWIPLYAALLYLYYRKMGWRVFLISLIFIALMVLLADQTSNFFKQNTPKFRPTHNPLIGHLVHTVNGYVGGSYGTVSGHAANSFALAMFTSFVFRKRWVTCVMLLWAVAVCYSRMYLGVHFPLDILFGTMTGLIAGTVAVKLFFRSVAYLRKIGKLPQQ